jgi:hypothetical protein
LTCASRRRSRDIDAASSTSSSPVASSGVPGWVPSADRSPAVRGCLQAVERRDPRWRRISLVDLDRHAVRLGDLEVGHVRGIDEDASVSSSTKNGATSVPEWTVTQSSVTWSSTGGRSWISQWR